MFDHWSVEFWKLRFFQGKIDLNQLHCRKSAMKNGRPLKDNIEKNTFLGCWSPWTKLKWGGLNSSSLTFVSREMVLKHTGKDIGCLEINVSSFLTAINILIATTQNEKIHVCVFLMIKDLTPQFPPL